MGFQYSNGYSSVAVHCWNTRKCMSEKVLKSAFRITTPCYGLQRAREMVLTSKYGTKAQRKQNEILLDVILCMHARYYVNVQTCFNCCWCTSKTQCSVADVKINKEDYRRWFQPANTEPNHPRTQNIFYMHGDIHKHDYDKKLCGQNFRNQIIICCYFSLQHIYIHMQLIYMWLG